MTKNKLFGLIFLLLGLLSTLIDRDATFLLFTLICGIPLLITRENLIEGE